uniref:Uncharacterized protein n=1 Tax=Globisporangium ultimum (strain ATCC 200006 / CBS 805.95 / DAOM BR144) TaxID=431595 RepID=K3WTT9_GLOUD
MLLSIARLVSPKRVNMALASVVAGAQKANEDGPGAADTTTVAAALSAAMEANGRMHSTVRLNQFTLQFEDAALESAYQASIHMRKKALWLRSLIPAAASHILFGLGDCMEHPHSYLQVTLPARIFLADALFVIFGLSFYTIPKITPLGFVSSTGGSWVTAILYAVLSFAVRPPERQAESILGFLYTAPVIGIFNTISYYSEYNSRERFVLRRRLSRERITLAVARTNTLVSPEGTDRFFKTLAHSNGPTFCIGVLLWGAFTTGGWASLPDTLKFVDEETGWAWFSHCAGVTVFLLVMTRQLLWLFVVPVLGAVILWMMTLTMPAEWIIFSAHSVGYGLLVASVIVAMGVFSWFVCAWKELVSFLTRSCFLYPQLQAGLENEYPLLVKIVSEYTAGFDPEILSSRMPANRIMDRVSADVRALRSGSEDYHYHAAGTALPTLSSMSPRRRTGGSVRAKLLAPGDDLHSHKHAKSETTMSEYIEDDNTENELLRGASEEGASVMDLLPSEVVSAAVGTKEEDERGSRMMSVLPSFKAGKCFFCSKNEAEHFVPACGMWGKWTHWRMNQQHGHPNELGSSSSSSALQTKPVMSMCTSYYDIQNQKSELEVRVAKLETANASLVNQLQQLRQVEKQTNIVNVQLKSEMRALEEKCAMDLQRQDAQWQQKLNAVLEESNRLAHERKLEVKRADAARASLRKQLETSQRLTEKAESARTKSMEEANKKHAVQLEAMQTEMASCKAEVESLRRAVQAASTLPSPLASPLPLLDGSFSSPASSSMSPSSPVANLQTLHPSRRLPYAQSLEIEGLRESSRKPRGDIDYSEPWRYALDSANFYDA